MEIARKDFPSPDNKSPRVYNYDLVVPPHALPDLVAAADMLTAMEAGSFYVSETDLNDPDGVRVRYIGSKDFTEFAELAKEVTQISEEASKSSDRTFFDRALENLIRSRKLRDPLTS